VSPIDCTGTQRVAFLLPAALQVPGTLQLADPSLAAHYESSEEAMPGCDPTTDYLTTSYIAGQLEILSLDGSTLSFRIFGSSTGGEAAVSADGLYAAPLCP
jgi:hypothetical protein